MTLQMKKFRVCAHTTISIYADIVANSMEEALEIAREEFDDNSLVQYCDGSIGIDEPERYIEGTDCVEQIENVELSTNWGIEFEDDATEELESVDVEFEFVKIDEETLFVDDEY